ncbi:MAG: MFS transporter, partial [Chloroflexi bacterium]|nr:MFS transporter [Chloroflexota bacterium]
MTIAKTFYFIFFAAAASLMPFLALYYQGLGLSGREIGLLAGIVPLATLISAAVWGAIADATHKHHLLLLAAIIGTAVSVYLMLEANTFILLIPVVTLYAFFLAPIIPLVDNSVLAALGARKDEYGRQRVWGSYGWGLAGAIIGFAIQRTGLNLVFYVYLVLFFILFFVAHRLPMSEKPISEPFWRGLRSLIANRHWLLFLAASLIAGMSLGIMLNYLFLLLEAMGASRTIMGLTLTFATISEIPIFLYSAKLLKRWDARFLLAVAMTAMVIRAFAYAGMTAPWQALIISLLHGLSFGLMWIAGVAYADKNAPAGLGATAQGVFN